MWFLCIFIIFDCYGPIFLPNPNSILFWNANCVQSIHFAPKKYHRIAWCQIFVVKRCFFIIQWFSQFWCISKLFKLCGVTVKQLAFCLYLFLGHDLSHPYDEKVDLCKTFFFFCSFYCRMQSFFALSNISG